MSQIKQLYRKPNRLQHNQQKHKTIKITVKKQIPKQFAKTSHAVLITVVMTLSSTHNHRILKYLYSVYHQFISCQMRPNMT